MTACAVAAKGAFLSQYGGRDFANVKFRPGAGFTSPFGLDNAFGTLRIHAAIDRGRDKAGKYPIYAPFDIDHYEYIEDYPSFGTLLILHTKHGFQVRIAHIEALAPAFAAMKRNIPAGVFIADAGEAGLSKGRHTHTEIVSEDVTCSSLDEILAEKYGYINVIEPYTSADVVKYCQENKVPGDPEKMYRDEWSRRKLFFLNQYVCDRIDYHSGVTRRFYSSKALFGM